MKLSVGKRILMFFHWLLSLLICAALAVYVIVPDFVRSCIDSAEAAVGSIALRAIGIVILVIYIALAVLQIMLIFGRKKGYERGFITVDSSDSGKVRIAISAIEQMVRQSVHSIDGITEMKIDIDNQDDAIAIGINASIASGSHVPTVTMNMQRAIRHFVEMNCGVAVRSVSISINSVTNRQDSTRRRFLGRQKQEAAGQALPTEAESFVQPDHAAPSGDETPFSGEGILHEEAPDADDGAPAFDFDKPYESEFAKDLAALNARELAADTEAASPDGDADGEEDADDRKEL